MRQRRETVEHPFGTMKARMGASLPDDDAAQGGLRDGAARAGLQHDQGDQPHGGPAADGSNAGIANLKSPASSKRKPAKLARPNVFTRPRPKADILTRPGPPRRRALRLLRCWNEKAQFHLGHYWIGCDAGRSSRFLGEFPRFKNREFPTVNRDRHFRKHGSLYG
jgi:hypothetical protein